MHNLRTDVGRSERFIIFLKLELVLQDFSKLSQTRVGLFKELSCANKKDFVKVVATNNRVIIFTGHNVSRHKMQ